MMLVCKESRRPFSWFFDEEIDTYIRRDQNGEINGSITGRNLPNPLSILEARMRMKQKGQIHPDSRVDADPVTKQLWEHRNAKFNN